MKIAGLQKVSLLDFPGQIAATLFLAGCNLNCGYCYNHWMIDADAVTEAMEINAFLDWLRSRVGKLQAVCLCGGEPLLNSELPSLLRQIREMGILTKVDTNGTLPERLKKVLDEGLVDFVAMDIKAPPGEPLQRLTGSTITFEPIAASMQVLRTNRVPYEFRTTVGPEMTMAELDGIAALLRPQERWYLQPFRMDETVREPWRSQHRLGVHELVDYAQQVRERLPLTRVRGEDNP